MIKSEFVSFISSNVSDLITGGKYEPLICELMNNSIFVFESNYTHIDSQSKGEPDFLDNITNQKYDVKLIINTKQGQDLCSRKKDILDYSEWIVRINNELYDCVYNPDNKIEDTIIYKIFVDLINKIKDDENLIVLFTYPFMNIYKKSQIDSVLLDYMDIIYNSLKQYFIKRDLYVIYPTMDNYIALRRMRDNKKEYLKSKNFNEYFSVISNKIVD